MAKSPTTLARELLEGDAGALEELRIHEFEDDEEAHDDLAVKSSKQISRLSLIAS